MHFECVLAQRARTRCCHWLPRAAACVRPAAPASGQHAVEVTAATAIPPCPPCAAPTRCGLLPPVNGRIARASDGGGSQLFSRGWPPARLRRAVRKGGPSASAAAAARRRRRRLRAGRHAHWHLLCRYGRQRARSCIFRVAAPGATTGPSARGLRLSGGAAAVAAWSGPSRLASDGRLQHRQRRPKYTRAVDTTPAACRPGLEPPPPLSRCSSAWLTR